LLQWSRQDWVCMASSGQEPDGSKWLREWKPVDLPALTGSGDEEVTVGLITRMSIPRGMPKMLLPMDARMELFRERDSRRYWGSFYSPGLVHAVIDVENASQEGDKDVVAAHTAGPVPDSVTSFIELYAVDGLQQLDQRLAHKVHFPPAWERFCFDNFRDVIDSAESWWTTRVRSSFSVGGAADEIFPPSVDSDEVPEEVRWIAEEEWKVSQTCTIEVVVSDEWATPQISYQATLSAMGDPPIISMIRRTGGALPEADAWMPEWVLNSEVTHRAKWLHRDLARNEHDSEFSYELDLQHAEFIAEMDAYWEDYEEDDDQDDEVAQRPANS
jgi:hypothetical protein